MKSENGWILPDGRYIDCEWEGHIKCAKEKFGMRERELEKTAVKVSCMPAMTRTLIFLGEEYRPNFLTTRERMTKAQLETIQKYCLRFRFRPPLDYFIQNNLEELDELSTEQVLCILAKND